MQPYHPIALQTYCLTQPFFVIYSAITASNVVIDFTEISKKQMCMESASLIQGVDQRGDLGSRKQDL